MTKSLPLALLAAGALVSGSAALAATQTQTKTMTKTTVAAKPATTMATKPMMASKSVKTTTRTTTAAKGRMVTAKLANGKTVTYNCALAGNASKAACK